MTDTIQQMAELLLKNSLDSVQEAIEKKLEETQTAFNAKLDGIKVSLNERINTLEAISGDTPLSITMGTVEEPKTKVVHSAFMKVLNILKSQKRIQKNIMFVGEAGSGKTHLASSLAEALGMKFYPMSVGLQTTKSDLLGFINAHGQYVTSPIREAFEKGGVLLLDEFDSAHAGVVTIINSLLANGHCSFPDRIVDKNPNFICIVACNTYGHGANIDYVGRNRLDGATLDRFIVVDVGYDKKLEKQLTNNDKWLEIINQIRKNVEKQGIKMIISPRASMNGADLLEAGFDVKDVLEMCILKGADKDTRTKCLQGINFGSERTESKSLSEYVRDTEKYITIEVRTQYENLDNILSYVTVNTDTIYKFCLSNEFEGTQTKVMFGDNWERECDGFTSVYFATKYRSHRIDLKDYEVEYMRNALYMLEKCDSFKIDNEEANKRPIAIELIKQGCRKPWKVITVEV